MLTILLLISQAVAHDFHVSITQVKYQDKALQATLRLFTDDLEAALEQECDCRLYLGTEKEHKQADTYLRNYVLQHFRLESPQQKNEFTLLGKEVEMELTYIYIEYPMKTKPKVVKITNSLLFELFADQRNIVNIELDDKLESAFLTPDQPTETINF